MYFYIYDTFLTDKKHERTIAEIETRLVDLGITGKIGRLGAFTNAKGLIRDEVKRGIKTIVAVGNDETLAKIVEGLGEAKVTLGIIPVGDPVTIATALGIPTGLEACDVLSRRVTQKIDLGVVNGRHFLSHLRIPGGNVVLEGDGKYRVTALSPDCDIVISNLRGVAGASAADGGYCAGDPMDGWLDALIEPRTGSGGIRGWFGVGKGAKNTVIPLRKCSVTSPEPIPAIADGKPFTNESLSIEIVPDRLKIITGRERVFAA